MESFLLTIIVAVAVIRWFYLKQRLAEMSQRIDALSRLVVQTQAQAKPITAPFPVSAPAATRPAPPPPPPPPPMGQVVTPPSPVVATPVPAVEAPPVLEPIAASVVAPPMTVAPPPTLVVEAPVSMAQPAAPVVEPVTPHVAPPPPPKPAEKEGPTPEPQPVAAPAFAASARAPRRSSADLEKYVGGNLFLKAGIFAIVVTIVFVLGYTFAHIGPLGRVLMSIGVSLAMLVGGFITEKRDRYRAFGRGLIGGGWAALYFTVYAMQSIDAAKVVDNPLLGAVLLLLVASGMIIHSLKYRSQTVTGLAYFIAFATLAITQVTPLSVIAVIPLSASLLYVAQRFDWKNFAVFGLVATYAICASRGDNGAPLWQGQTLFAIYWLMFEAFDVMRPHRALLPLNALGFLTLSLAAWDKRDAEHIWIFLGVTAVAYLAGAIVRARSDQWRPAATLTAALFAAAIFVKLDYQWVAVALLIEAELFYLAGVRLGAPYLRVLAGGLFTLEVGHFLVRTVGATKAPVWTPAAIANVVVFYANRALRSADVYYGYAAAAMMALIAGFDAPHGDRGLAWMVLAAGPFLIGWRWRQVDFRIQAYALAALGPAGMAFWWPEPPLSMGIGAALAYTGALCALKSNPDRFTDGEPDALRSMGSLFASCMLAALVWHVVPAQYLGLSWLALAAVLLELGMRNLPVDFRRQSYALALVGAGLVVINNFLPIHNDGPWKTRLTPAAAALVLYAMSARARKEERGVPLNAGSFIATGFLLTGLWALLPPVAVGPAWAVVALVLMEFDMPVLTLECHLVSIAAFARLFFANFDFANFDDEQRLMTALTVIPVLLSHYFLWSRTHKRFYLYTAAILASVLARFEMGRVFTTTGWAVLMVALLYAGKRWKIRDLEWQSYALAAMAIGRCWSTNFYSPDMFAGFAGPIFVGATVIACLYIAQLLNELDSRPRMYFSVLGSLLLAVLLFSQVSGSLLTVAWGAEGIVLMSAGFPLRDRVLRLSGMALLLCCILKLPFWDLRHLEILQRIIAFGVLGVILVAGSLVYTRFGDVLLGRTGRAGEPRETV